jgi:hypothetical protein
MVCEGDSGESGVGALCKALTSKTSGTSIEPRQRR